MPAPTVLTRLEEHAELGDLAALRAELAAARASEPSAAMFLDALDTLAGQAQLTPLRAWIAAALNRASAP